MITLQVRSFVWLATGAFLAAIVMALFASGWQAEAAVADESTYVPITPCRLLDMRPAPDTVGPKGTPLAAGTPHTQQVTGRNGDCNIPADATAIAMNVTITDPTAASFLVLYPSGATPPKAANLNWVAGQAPTPNKVDVKLSTTGTIDLFSPAGTVNVIADATGYYTDSTITQLSQRLAALETKLADVSIETVDGHRTVRFTDVNVQIVNGTDNTYVANGRGNLIVGYNEPPEGGADRTGSHNLVVGPFHEYTASGGAALGFRSTISGVGATVTGGSGNTASGNTASVSGGLDNSATTAVASVSGGQDNQATGIAAVVVGGDRNDANGDRSVVVGGFNNTAGQSDVNLGGENRSCDVDANAAVCAEANIWFD